MGLMSQQMRHAATMGHPNRLPRTVDHPDGGAAACLLSAQLSKARCLSRSVGHRHLEQRMDFEGEKGPETIGL